LTTPFTFSGHLALRAAARDDGRTVLAGQSFRAPFHLSKPYWDADTQTLLVQVVNPTAGILAGDRLESEIAVEAGAALLVTTPSASRVFRMKAGSAEFRQHFAVADGGWLEVLPEPLVPHRGSVYRQVTTIDVERGGGLFFVDQLMPGRIGHGEVWAWERLSLDLTVRVAGELLLRERLEHSGAELQALSQLMGSGDTACFANAILLAPPDSAETASWRDEVAALHRDGIWVGASPLRGPGWSIKLVAPDAVRLRQTVRDVRAVLARRYSRLGCDPRKL
jgi:urease accessory protein